MTHMTAHALKDVEKGEHPSTAHVSANLYLLWKSIQQFLRKLENDLLHDPALPFLDIYPKKTPSYYKDT